MPRIKRKTAAYSLVGRLRVLQTVAGRIQVEAERAESLAAAGRLKEQVLTDICRYMELIYSLRAQHNNRSTSRESEPSSEDLTAFPGTCAGAGAGQPRQHSDVGTNGSSWAAVQDLQQVQVPEAVRSLQQQCAAPQDHARVGSNTDETCATRASAAAAAAACAWGSTSIAPTHAPLLDSSCGCSARQRSRVLQQASPHLARLPPHAAAVLSEVPQYCCLARLLQDACPELVSTAVRLTKEELSQLYSACVYELLMLLELQQRQQREAQQQQQQGPGLLGSDEQQQLQQQAKQRPVQSDMDNGAATDTRSGAVASGSAAEENAAQGSSDVWAGIRAIADGFWGLSCITLAVSPQQAMEFGMLNNRLPLEQQQQRQAPLPPLSHWQAVAQRLGLSHQQAVYLGACADHVAGVVQHHNEALQQLAPLAGGHSLLVLATEALQEQQQQERLQQQQEQQWQQLLTAAQCQQQPLATTKQQEGSIGAAAYSQRQQQQPTLVHSGLGAADAADAVIKALSGHTSQLAVCSALLGLCLGDCLDVLQRARLMTASYPWGPHLLPVCICAGQLTRTQELPQQQQQQQRCHQDEHRQQWWRDLMKELPLSPDEAAAVEAAAGVTAAAADTTACAATGAAAAAAAAGSGGGGGAAAVAAAAAVDME